MAAACLWSAKSQATHSCSSASRMPAVQGHCGPATGYVFVFMHELASGEPGERGLAAACVARALWEAKRVVGRAFAGRKLGAILRSLGTDTLASRQEAAQLRSPAMGPSTGEICLALAGGGPDRGRCGCCQCHRGG